MTKLSARQFQRDLGDFAAELRRKIEAECDGFVLDPAASVARRARAHADFGFFCATYFPHYLKHAPSSLHQYLFARLPALVNDPRSQTDAIAAPRGEAKSTLVSLLFVLWCDLTARKHYIVLVMDAFEQAAVQLESVKAEYEYNPRLSADFPAGVGRGRVWQNGVIVTPRGCKIEVFGSGKRIRGRRHGPHRPDLVIGDDLENDENVRSPEQRDKLQSWLTKSVMKLGGAGVKLDVLIVGTILHYDSVLARLLENPLWRGRRFKALLRWPDRMDLWDRWEIVYRQEGDAAAQRFYDQNATAMQTGAEVSWPAGRPLYDLMILRARDGHASFDSELQNDPINAESALFGTVTFWVDRRDDWLFYGACDPSLGKTGASRDPSAILIGGYCRATGILDVVEASIRKRLPDRIIEDIIALHREYRCLVWGIESVQFQEFLRTELIKRSAQAGCPVPARAILPHADKLLRIESLQPHVVNGLIRFHPSQTTLLEQLRHFPAADHDDGPDALHMLWTLALSSGAGIAAQATGQRRFGVSAERDARDQPLTQTGWGTVAGWFGDLLDRR
ncbi:phage terminase large subunit [Thiocystis violascens]|uniref:Putative phage protein, putative large terminase n=1 Tax=Thiocystis violascens (strain ATCC 17096 / DSM 198 / 6111) TaxID=765911 RepID=I3YGV4_THIV6|nr:phage terminase large subunit [Thiocystis violascens]AFL76222.1 putative phage protein, putative large terminase [Thiocystis violascens DSM 198]